MTKPQKDTQREIAAAKLIIDGRDPSTDHGAMTDLKEPVLADDYPVYGNFLYIADGKVVRSDVFGTVRLTEQDAGLRRAANCGACRAGARADA